MSSQQKTVQHCQSFSCTAIRNFYAWTTPSLLPLDQPFQNLTTLAEKKTIQCVIVLRLATCHNRILSIFLEYRLLSSPLVVDCRGKKIVTCSFLGRTGDGDGGSAENNDDGETMGREHCYIYSVREGERETQSSVASSASNSTDYDVVVLNTDGAPSKSD